MVDDQRFDGAGRRYEPESELLLERLEERRERISRRRSFLELPGEDKIPGAGQAGCVSHGAAEIAAPGEPGGQSFHGDAGRVNSCGADPVEGEIEDLRIGAGWRNGLFQFRPALCDNE